jgi:hypothetical protein
VFSFTHLPFISDTSLLIVVVVVDYLLKYSGRCLMGSRLMGSMGYWDQIEPDFPVPKNSLVPNSSI